MKSYVCLAVLAGVSMIAADAFAGNSFRYSSEAGDYIGGGKKGVYVPSNATFTLNSGQDTATIGVKGMDGTWWNINIGMPRGQKFQPGSFYNAERTSFRTGRSPGIDVSGNGRGCNQVWGKIGVRQVAYDASDKLISIEASFVQRCEGATAPSLVGVINYNAEPLELSLKSDPGDYIGGGVEKAYHGDSSTFSLQGSPSRFQYNASGLRDQWSALISAPSGQLLKPGFYLTKRFSDASNAGLDFFGDGRGCNDSTGTLKIVGINMDANGSISGLNASFEQHCEGGQSALKGVIRFGI